MASDDDGVEDNGCFKETQRLSGAKITCSRNSWNETNMKDMVPEDQDGKAQKIATRKDIKNENIKIEQNCIPALH
eukprot:6490640-Amphidinium_carterae.3